MPGETRIRPPGAAESTADWIVGLSAGTWMTVPEPAETSVVAVEVVLVPELQAAVSRATAPSRPTSQIAARERVARGVAGEEAVLEVTRPPPRCRSCRDPWCR